MNKYFKFEPVATFQAAQVLTTAVILLLAYAFTWPAVTIGLVSGAAVAFYGFIATFVRGAVTPNATLEQLKNLSPQDTAALRQLDK